MCRIATPLPRSAISCLAFALVHTGHADISIYIHKPSFSCKRGRTATPAHVVRSYTYGRRQKELPFRGNRT